MFENRQVRASGQRPPEAAPPGTKPNTVLDVIAVEQVAVRFVDPEGNLHITTLVKVGNAYYEPAAAEEWTGKLAPVKDWLQKALAARAESAKPAAIPSADTVEVLP